MVLIWLTVPLWLHAKGRKIYDEQNFYFQKQIQINNVETCQAVQIDRDWLLTAAHCVEPFKKQTSCKIRVIVAQGDLAQASALVPCSKAVLPEPIVGKDNKLALPFDLALIPFSAEDEDYEFHTLANEELSPEEFADILEQDERLDGRLSAQWKQRNPSSFPALYAYQSSREKLLENVILVPLWEEGSITYKTEASQIVYIGGKFPSLWATKGFGVENGNSGGAVAVVLPNGKLGILGIVYAKSVNPADEKMRQEIAEMLPGFEQTDEYFFFHGFADKTTLPFIKSTIRSGNSPTIKKIKEVPTNLLEPETSFKKIKAR